MYLPFYRYSHTGMLISHFLLQIKKDQHLTDNNSMSQRVARKSREPAKADMKAPVLWIPVQCSFYYRTHSLSLVYFSALVNVDRMVNTGGFEWMNLSFRGLVCLGLLQGPQRASAWGAHGHMYYFFYNNWLRPLSLWLQLSLIPSSIG